MSGVFILLLRLVRSPSCRCYSVGKYRTDSGHAFDGARAEGNVRKKGIKKVVLAPLMRLQLGGLHILGHTTRDSYV